MSNPAKGSAQEMEVNRIEDVDHPSLIEDEKARAKDDDALSINEAALGDDLPPGYFYSPRFLGAVAVRANLRASSCLGRY
jgi:hypothetical protein